MTDIVLRPDAKGRIGLGEIARNVSSYRMTIRENGQLVLDPYVEIPMSEKWIFEDKELLQKLKQDTKENQK